MFSYFTTHSQNVPAGIISLSELYRQLIAPDKEPFLKAAYLTKHLRAATDEAEEKAIKSQLPAICPGATLDTRATGATLEQQNIKYSGFAQIDIDLHDNPNMTDAAEVRDKLAQIPYIALTAISARGRGVWALIALKEPGRFTEYSETLTEYFKQARVTIDKSKSKRPTELRYFAPDAGAILKNDYLLFPLIRPQAKPKPAAGTKHHTGATLDQVQRWVTETTGFDLVDGQKHYYLFWLAYALRKNGNDSQTIYQLIFDNVLPESCIHSNCISGGIAYANNKGTYTIETAKTAPRNTPERFNIAHTPISQAVKREIATPNINTTEVFPAVQPSKQFPSLDFYTPDIRSDHPNCKTWSSEIAELETYFRSMGTYTKPIKLNIHSKVTDYSLFLESHFAILKMNDGNKTFIPYLDRLTELKQVLKNVK